MARLNSNLIGENVRIMNITLYFSVVWSCLAKLFLITNACKLLSVLILVNYNNDSRQHAHKEMALFYLDTDFR